MILFLTCIVSTISLWWWQKTTLSWLATKTIIVKEWLGNTWNEKRFFFYRAPEQSSSSSVGGVASFTINCPLGWLEISGGPPELLLNFCWMRRSRTRSRFFWSWTATRFLKLIMKMWLEIGNEAKLISMCSTCSHQNQSEVRPFAASCCLLLPW